MAEGWGPFPKEYEGLGTSILPKDGSVREGKDCGTEGGAKQSFKDDCDVNLIVKRHAQTGMWDHLNPRMPTYGDNSGAMELQDAIETVRNATDEFWALPAEVRAICNNDPVVFMQEVNDPVGVLALAEAGLPMADGWEPPAPAEVPAEEGGETPPTPEG